MKIYVHGRSVSISGEMCFVPADERHYQNALRMHRDYAKTDKRTMDISPHILCVC